jgi:hypothetical protein
MAKVLQAETPWLGPLDRLTEIVESRSRESHRGRAVRSPGRLPLKPLLTSRVRGVSWRRYWTCASG